MKPTIIDRLLSLFVVPERERLRNLLVPELADLRQQLDQARRLAGEAQARYRQEECHNLDLSGRVEQLEKQLRLAQDKSYGLSAELACAKADLDERHGPLLGPLAMERDQLLSQLTLEVKNATRLAAEGDQLRARVAGLEASNHRQGIELSEAREANEALAFDRAKQVNHYNGGLRYRRLSDELIIRDDGYRIEYQIADSRNTRPTDWELWAEYKQSNYTGSEIADALMGHKETP